MPNEIELLTDIKKSIQELLEVEKLTYALEPMRYITRKLRSGEAEVGKGIYYQLVAPGGTFTVTFTNPEGYVWIGVTEVVEVSQNAVFEFTEMMDDQLLPWIYVARLVSFEYNWSKVLPFGVIVKTQTTIIATNHDIANQWFVGYVIGAFLRKDVWERDSKTMDLAAEKYTHTELANERK